MSSRSMPATTDIEQRDRALIAFTILTGARDGAIASFKLRHIDVAEGKIDQDAREVRTKFSKSFVTTFFPVGEDIRAVVADWVNYLRHGKALGPRRSPVSGDQGRGRGQISGSERWDSTASTGAAPVQSGPFSSKHLRQWGCRTSTHIASGRRWRFSADNDAERPRSTKLGRRISAMNTY